ncbi:hypothetical protein OE88DRAFT_1660312 [Heliocybe sulcata]|uniref:Uncharacterized protein n=1 Tax=Heliocybe sulcata TaxID=5364 RepID=A0A5C3N1J4_9AGAM|nr:hypothetical protein OE88DRAFT_1660312 [Heliocybe sulcata]
MPRRGAGSFFAVLLSNISCSGTMPYVVSMSSALPPPSSCRLSAAAVFPATPRMREA